MTSVVRGTLEPVPLETRRPLPLRATVHHGSTHLELVVLASVADAPALRAADPALRPRHAAPTVPTSGLPLVRAGRAAVLTGSAGSLDAEHVVVTVVVRSGGAVAWSQAVAPGQVHPMVLGGAWVADLHVLALDLTLGALSGAGTAGDDVRLALDWAAGGRLDVAPVRRHTTMEGPFDALA